MQLRWFEPATPARDQPLEVAVPSTLFLMCM